MLWNSNTKVCKLQKDYVNNILKIFVKGHLRENEEIWILALLSLTFDKSTFWLCFLLKMKTRSEGSLILPAVNFYYSCH